MSNPHDPAAGWLAPRLQELAGVDDADGGFLELPFEDSIYVPPSS